jgi:GGDEF domain-containing protein
MNKPPVLNAFLLPAQDASELGSVETPFLVRLLRPASFAVWVLVFCVQAQTVIARGGGTNWFVLGFTTFLFAVVHLQFWYEESEQGRRFHRAIDRLRGRIYEDEVTSLPNSRHFVFELRRQMMRSVRSGRGFSLVLTDVIGFETLKNPETSFLPAVGRALRHAVGEGDFVAHLQGPIFAAIVADDRLATAAMKADAVLPAIASAIPNDHATRLTPVVSFTGYEGELEVRDFLRRAQRDLVAAGNADPTARLAAAARSRPQRPGHTPDPSHSAVA